MLDNILMPTMANATAAASPTAELKCADINSNPSSSPTKKAKTIFNWLRSATKTNTTSATATGATAESSSAKSNSTTADCTCATAAKDAPNKSKQFPDATLRDFRGVQTLRHLWNKRISANEAASTATRCNKTTFGSSGKGNKLTKSISCLVNATAASNEHETNSKTDELRRRLQTKRAQSLHDCTQLDQDDEVEEKQSEEVNTADPHAEIHFLHREKDNFYKYKTAEQAAKHIAREASVRAKTRRLSAGIVSGGSGDDAHFPATTTNGAIHWLRRQDIVAVGHLKPSAGERRASDVEMMAADDNKVIIITTLSARDVISNSNDCCADDTRNAQTCSPAATAATDSLSVSSDDTDTLTAANSPRHAISRRRHSKREISSPTTTISSAKRGSTDSSSSNIAAGRSCGARRTLSSASSTRKYSFKTHAPRIYHASRKMSNKDGSGSSSGTSGTSMVAKLTQQFNEIIQKDKKLLDEVKRKKGVLMSRGGHVYKVVQNTGELGRTASSSKTASPSISRSGSLAKDSTTTMTKTTTTNSSMVQRNIKKFENGLDTAVGEKPIVPAKSAQVLRKCNECVKTHNIPSPNSSSKRLNLNLNLPHQSNHVELQLKLDATKKKTHLAATTLEMVREEVKTPLETEEKSIATATVSMEKEEPQLDVMSNAKKAEVTYATINSNRQTEIISSVVDEVKTKVIDAEVPKQTQLGGTDNGETTTTRGGKSTVENQQATIANWQPEEGKEKPLKVAPTLAANLEQQPQQGNSDNDTKANVKGAKTTVDAESMLITATIKRMRNEEVEAEVNADDVSDGVSDEKVKQRKHKYAKIYEKFRFRSPFGSSSSGSQSKKTSPPSRSPEKSTSSEKPATSTATKTPELTAELADGPASKILDALEVIDQKLKGLTVSEKTESIVANNDVEPATAAVAIVLCENNDFEQRVLPNSSFVYQASAKQVSNNQLLVTQAVNVALVNSLEGEQMIMEQKELQKQQQLAKLATELDIKIKKDQQEEQCEEEALYEPIASVTATATKLPKTEPEPSPQQSFLFKRCVGSSTNKTNEAVCENAVDEIYQTLEEVQLQQKTALETDQTTTTKTIAVTNVADTLNDYESIAGSCEQTTPATNVPSNLLDDVDDDYEVFEAIADEPTTLPQTPQVNLSNTQYQSNTTIMRNTNDELPELPKPKRRLPKSPMPGKRPPKPAALAATDAKSTATTTTTTIKTTTQELLDEHDVDDDHHYYADDENIYDTIKGSHCYESLHSAEGVVKLQKTASAITKSSSGDTVSLTSNCYESITQYRRLVTTTNGHTQAGSNGSGGSRSGSTLTISSDHKTNSLYEVSLAAGLLYGAGSLGCGRSGSSSAGSTVGGVSGVGSSMPNSTTGGERRDSSGAGSSKHYPHSNAASSDNSDGWIDISDAEADVGGKGAQTARQQFIVVRERSKIHRSPDWSKRVRDKRLHQKKAMSCIEDDSDHYYESLSPLGNKRHSTQLVQRTSSSLQHHRRNQDQPRYVTNASQRSKKYSASAHALGHGVSDDYDSFDTDTDDIYETEENMKNQHNDSGVDIRNVKLPDPPHSTNQVYAMVKKLKNFISNKKSPGSGHKHGSGSQQKLYENSSQFYVEGNIYENTPKTKAKPMKPSKKVANPPTNDGGDDDIYENTEFHTPPAAKQLSTSERNLNTSTTIPTSLTTNTDDLLNATTSTATTALRSKSKSGKSFKSRLRKSLVGSSFDTKQMSALTPTRSTFYIEDPTHGGSGELDSGFSEKASSGDLPAVEVDSAAVPTPDSQKFATVARKAKKETKSANTQRRRTTIGIRPHEPPPPPPSEDAKAKHHSVAAATTSWYAECGVFKNGGGNIGRTQDEHSLSGSKSTVSQNGSSMMGMNGTSWYAEAGLYQTSGISVASSSGSSGVSTGNEGGLGDDMPHSMFLNEPLYQIYSAAKLESISRDMEDHDGSTDGYEEIGQNGGTGRDGAGIQRNEECQKRARPSALQLIGPKNGPSRTLWSEIPEVINSCIMPTLLPRERGLQEAKFEIITSEASYLKSLNLLRSHFMMHPLFRDTGVVSARDRKALFSYIVPVHECSERLLTELESCWQDNIMLLGLSRRIYTIAERYFHVYIAFCEHQGRMDRTLRRLKAAKGVFSQNLDLLEASATCCGLNLHSFLMLPMQRITRLPLLIDAVFSKVSSSDDEYDSWKMTLAIMNKIVTQCNEAANRCEQAYEIERISRQLEFPTSIRALAIAPMGVSAPGSKPRFLVKKGELTHLIWRGDDAKLTFGKKFTKTTIFAFLFSDLLVLTKRKAEDQFLVFDYCPRSMLTISSGDALPQLPTKDINQTSKNLILMTLLENNERKTIELVLACPSVSEQERWLQAMRPPEAETPGEKLYEQWDCPQVIVKHAYEGSKEPDVLNLEIGDVVNVSRKLPDGWYQGERIRDGAIGWFPGSYTEEVNSAHVRARNLKQRYRLLTFTATYLESQKRK